MVVEGRCCRIRQSMPDPGVRRKKSGGRRKDGDDREACCGALMIALEGQTGLRSSAYGPGVDILRRHCLSRSEAG